MIARVEVKKLNPKAFMPMYMDPGDAGCDVFACVPQNLSLYPGETMLVPTGLAFAIEDGFECQVRSRSGLALRNGIIVLNSPGTIDCGYRGEVRVILHNSSGATFTIKHGDRIAQLVFAPITKAHFVPVVELPLSSRGTGGFGSTGV